MNRKGVTLVELLIVTVVIAVLAGIALPMHVKIKEKAYIAAMKSDLRNLVRAQEAYFADQGMYTDELADLNFNASRGVDIDIEDASERGWEAEAEHDATNWECTIWVGVDNGDGNEGEPVCSRS